MFNVVNVSLELEGRVSETTKPIASRGIQSRLVKTGIDQLKLGKWASWVTPSMILKAKEGYEE